MPELLINRLKKTEINQNDVKDFSESVSKSIRDFHKSFYVYSPTPLITLNSYAKQIGVNKIYVKDESHRFGLNAFKVLGASYTIANIIKNVLGLTDAELSFTHLKQQIKKQSKDITLVTATDGNHGKGVAWSANQLGIRSVVYMPNGSSPYRIDAIKSLGADVTVIDGNYDDAVQFASDMSAKNNWILVQDTAFDNYESIPFDIMQGYLTILDEFLEQNNNDKPTHIFIQCGVGSLAASILAGVISRFGNEAPLFGIIEPVNAACFFKSGEINDGSPHRVEGKLESIMAGLSCGKPSTTAWNICRDYADYFIKCEDNITMDGIRLYALPYRDDKKIISGESGAVSLGFLNYVLMKDKTGLKEKLKLDSNSKIFLISTEGDTDPAMYSKIVSSSV